MRSLSCLPKHIPTPRGTVSVAAFAGLLLAGCGGDKVADNPQSTGKLDQQVMCVTKDLEPDSSCKPGQRVTFLPDRWGGEQYPVVFAAMNCDLRYTVVMTNGGVSCIYLSARAPGKESPADAASSPASSSGK